MFKQVKSALFWYYLYKFRRRFVLILILLLIALFSNFIYSDVVEFLKLKNMLGYLEFALLGKWLIIIFNIVFSFYLIITLFKKEDEIKELKKEPKVEKKTSDDKFTQREKDLLYKKKLKTQADRLIDK